MLTITYGNTNAPNLNDRQKGGGHDAGAATRSTTPITINQLSAA
jgi:hypothetical protein